jgi:hypothetical protein
MTPASGSKLGPYEIVGPLGAGEGGEVYLSRDAKLGRDMVLKVLPSAFVLEANRMARFQREAKVLELRKSFWDEEGLSSAGLHPERVTPGQRASSCRLSLPSHQSQDCFC